MNGSGKEISSVRREKKFPEDSAEEAGTAGPAQKKFLKESRVPQRDRTDQEQRLFLILRQA